jgi:hypothetical protein
MRAPLTKTNRTAAADRGQPATRGVSPGVERGVLDLDQTLLGRHDRRVDSIARAEALQNLFDVPLDGVFT